MAHISSESLNTEESLRADFTDPGRRIRSERWWTKREKLLEAAGYRLRPRFRQEWVPSWHGTKEFYFSKEDGLLNIFRVALDATRISDGKPVMMKQVVRAEGPYELDIATYLSSEGLMADPRNHTVPLLEVIELPNDERDKIMVMPLLRPFNNPKFETYGEAVAFMTQIFEGLQFMHEHNIAHRDCTKNNIMLDPSSMYPESFHPVKLSRRKNYKGKAKHYTRTQRPSKYYFIDFGLSRRYDPAAGPPLDEPLQGGDKTAPEHRDQSNLCNPFFTDIYYLGNLIRERFLYKRLGFEFVEPLVADMIQEDPEKRPKIEEVVTRFAEIRKSLSSRKLRSRMIPRKEIGLVGSFRSWGYLYRTAGYILTKKSPIPDP
ncbi:hypothetical protein FA95DRAFT_1683028 [Auriscalpium vulgare]|uniref:Uncharacterized protein n=1 Tax=Auriscalpium vulgare TaxID=40419 RepID=A0ACB8RC39_9AGAM|nr:hypothetical protein FA95DRAFT_1683028 [Auriscalpium vulgare]